jgi:hypothetical protein
MTGIAWTDDVAARLRTTAARAESVTRASGFIGITRHDNFKIASFLKTPIPIESARVERRVAIWLPLDQYDSSARGLFRSN